MPNPIEQALAKLEADQLSRHAWLFKAAEQIRKQDKLEDQSNA